MRLLSKSVVVSSTTMASIFSSIAKISAALTDTRHVRNHFHLSPFERLSFKLDEISKLSYEHLLISGSIIRATSRARWNNRILRQWLIVYLSLRIK